MVAQTKLKKENLQAQKGKIALLNKMHKNRTKPVQQQKLSIEEVIKQVINHHIGTMM